MAVVRRRTAMIAPLALALVGSLGGACARRAATDGNLPVVLAACDTVPKGGGQPARVPTVTGRMTLTGTFVGSVDERITGDAVRRVVVRVSGNDTRDVVTDSTGGFLIEDLKPGRYAVILLRIGYDGTLDSIDVVANDVVTKRYHLQFRSCP